MQAEEFVREGRSTQPGLPPPHLLQLVAHREESLPETAEEGDQQAAFRAVVLEELRRTLSLGDRSLLRFLLEQEIAYHKTAWGIVESIRLCGFLLFVLAQVEDIALLWEAKTTSFDTMCGFDTQFLVGAGVAPSARLSPIYPGGMGSRGENIHRRRPDDWGLRRFRALPS